MKFEEYKKEALKDPEVKMYYDALQPQYDLLNQLIEVRKEKVLRRRSWLTFAGSNNPTSADLRMEEFLPLLNLQ